MNRTHKPIIALGIAFLLMAISAGFAATAMAVHGGAPPARLVDLVWHDDALWDSVVLGELHGNPKPHTLDAFYLIMDGGEMAQNPVAGAGPGDSDYNGGRWLPTVLNWVGAGDPDFRDGDDVEAAIGGDLVFVGTGTPFLCPLTNPNNS